jgi:hypothetical protein
MMSRRVKPGDVVEVQTADAFLYLHYIGRHVEYGDSVKVCTEVYNRRVPIGADMFRGGYFVFYPVSASVAKGLAVVVGHLPSGSVPTRLRRPGARVGRRVETWVIEDVSGETVRRELSDEERSIPIAAIWNHEFLLERVTGGWRPEMDA